MPYADTITHDLSINRVNNIVHFWVRPTGTVEQNVEVSQGTALLMWNNGQIGNIQVIDGFGADWLGVPRGTRNPAWIEDISTGFYESLILTIEPYSPSRSWAPFINQLKANKPILDILKTLTTLQLYALKILVGPKGWLDLVTWINQELISRAAGLDASTPPEPEIVELTTIRIEEPPIVLPPPPPLPPPLPPPTDEIYEIDIETRTNPLLPIWLVTKIRNILLKGNWGLTSVVNTAHGYKFVLVKTGSPTSIFILIMIAAALAIIAVVVISATIRRVSDNTTRQFVSDDIKNSINTIIFYCDNQNLTVEECQELIDAVKNAYADVTPPPNGNGFKFPDIQPILWAMVAISLISVIKPK